jgi:hypothetical protein
VNTSGGKKGWEKRKKREKRGTGKKGRGKKGDGPSYLFHSIIDKHIF